MHGFWHDFRYGLRLLGRNPASSAVIILILAVGIGASSSLYSIIDGAWLHAFAYRYHDQFIALRAKFPRRDLTSWFFSAPEYFDVRRLTDVFSETTALRHIEMNIEEGESSERVSATEATASLFRLTNVPPLLGRVFTAEEDRPGRREGDCDEPSSVETALPGFARHSEQADPSERAVLYCHRDNAAALFGVGVGSLDPDAIESGGERSRHATLVDRRCASAGGRTFFRAR